MYRYKCVGNRHKFYFEILESVKEIGYFKNMFEKGKFVTSMENGRKVMSLMKLFSKIVIVMKVWKKRIMKRKER